MNTGSQNRLAIRTGKPSGKRTVAWFVLTCGAFAIFLPLDSWIATWLDIDNVSGDVCKAINLMELFGHGSGALLILAGVISLMPERWRDVIRLVFGWGLTGMTINYIKILVLRFRPAQFYPGFSGDEHSWIGTLYSSSGHEFALQNGRYLTDSFPSGHSGQAAVLAVMLSIMYPRGRYFFAALAVLACLQRVMGHAHWASDTAAGAAIGIVCGYIAFRFPFPKGFREPQLTE